MDNPEAWLQGMLNGAIRQYNPAVVVNARHGAGYLVAMLAPTAGRMNRRCRSHRAGRWGCDSGIGGQE
jgi:hypothetical protein